MLVAAIIAASLSSTALANDRSSAVFSDGIWRVNLFGTREQMAAQYGLTVRDKLDDTAFWFFSRRIENSVLNSDLLKNHPTLGRLTKAALDRLILNPLMDRIPDEDYAPLKAFAEGAGIPIRDALKAQIVPDAGQWFTANIFASVSDFGCTSFALKSAKSASGFLHARNLDYDGYGIFDKNPAVVYYHPSPDSTGKRPLNYVAFSSLGLPSAGITAVNEAGIIVDLHQAYLDAVSLGGTPILTITEKIAREAHTLAEAEAILRHNRFTSGWMLLISSYRENQVALAEVSADGITFQTETREFSALTNHVFSESHKSLEFAIDYGFYEDSRLRLQHVQTLLGQKPRLTIQDSVDVISSGAPSRFNNIQSLLIVPGQDTAYVAVVPQSWAKPTQGTYIPVRLGLFKQQEPAIKSLRNSQPQSQASVQAQALVRQAANATGDRSDYTHALELVLSARSLQPGDPIYPFFAGLIALKIGAREEDPARAAQIIEKSRLMLEASQAGSRHLTEYQEAVTDLFMGRIADIQNNRTKALTYYEAAQKRFFSRPLSEAIEHGIDKACTRKSVRNFIIDFTTGDLIRFR